MPVPPRLLAVMCGPAFSGKTTLSRALVVHGFVRLSLDDVLRSNGVEPGDGLPDEWWGRALSHVCSGIEDLARVGVSALVDDTSCYRWLRDRYRQIATGCSLQTVLIVLRIERAEVMRRVQTNADSRQRQGIWDSVLREHLDRFEWPGPDEDPLVLDALWPLERQVEATIDRLLKAIGQPGEGGR